MRSTQTTRATLVCDSAAGSLRARTNQAIGFLLVPLVLPLSRCANCSARTSCIGAISVPHPVAHAGTSKFPTNRANTVGWTAVLCLTGATVHQFVRFEGTSVLFCGRSAIWESG